MKFLMQPIERQCFARARHFVPFACSLLFSSQVFSATSAEVLPAGVRAMAFVFGQSSSINSQFSSSGSLVDLASPINQSVSISDLAAKEPRLDELRDALNTFGSGEIGDQLLMLQLSGNVTVVERRYVPALLWGLSDRFSVGVIVPVIHRQVDAGFRSSLEQQFDAISAAVGATPTLAQALDDLKNHPNLSSAGIEKAIFTDLGYKVPGPIEKSALGDVEVESRFLTTNKNGLVHSLRMALRLPTGDGSQDLSQIVDRPLSRASWGLRLGTFQDVGLARIWGQALTLRTGASITYSLPRYRTLAFRKSPDENLPNLLDPNSIEDVLWGSGLESNVSLGLSQDLWNGVVSFSGSYVLDRKERDSIWGSRNLDYSSFTSATFATEQSVEWGLDFSTLPLFLAKTFDVPVRVSLFWVQPFTGRGGVYAPYGRADVVVLF